MLLSGRKWSIRKGDSTKKMWESPIYKFRVPKDDGNELKEIVFDVTGSAPPFLEPSPNLKSVLEDIFKSDTLKKIDTVLEFGAGKLKNTPFILKQGKIVYSVEFKELMDNSHTKENIRKCKKYGSKFKNIIFPNPFLSDTNKFDLALLINVPPVMPVFAERLYMLQILHEKIGAGKYLLWLAQKEGGYKPIREKGKNDFGDGLWMGKGRKFKTFYKYHNVEELDELMSLYGFRLIKKYGGADDARLYEKTENILFEDVLTPSLIRKHIPIDSTIKDPVVDEFKVVKQRGDVKPVLPNPEPLSIETLYKDKIKRIPIGATYAEIYHRVVSHAIARIFRTSLRNMEIKVQIDGGVKIIDTLFTNCAQRGFFETLKSKVECAYPIVEVKNISDEPSNVDFDQLNGRLNKNHGHFGILVCRKIDDEDAAYARCKTHLPDNHIIFLTDEEIFDLLELEREHNDEEISDFMDKKLRRLLFKG